MDHPVSLSGLRGIQQITGSGEMERDSSSNGSTSDSASDAMDIHLGENKGSTLGPFILGFVFDMILFGILIHQALRWVIHFKAEKRFIRIITMWVLFASTFTTCFITWYIWLSFVINFSIYSTFLDVSKIAWIIPLDVSTVIPVQAFYVHKAYKLHKENKWVIAMVSPFLVSTLVGAIAAKVFADQTNSFSGRTTEFVYIWLGSITVADVLLTGLIMFGLYRSRTGWSHTNLLDRLIKISVETQLPCALSAIAMILNYGLSPSSHLNIFWMFFHPKIYAVCLLAVLNYRYTLKKTMVSSLNDDPHARSTHLPSARNRMHQETTYELSEIKVETTIFTETHHIPQIKSVGVNRMPLSQDEESAIYIGQEGDEYGSTIELAR